MLQAVYLVLCCACLLTLTLASVAWCPNRCNGNGVCSKKGSCECFPGFNGVDCSQRICPSDIAWVDFPRRNNTAHAPFTECSNMGTCDRTTGLCKCRTGFSGAACERMDCPMGQTPYSKANFLYEAKTCSGNGRCVSLRELSTYEDYSQYFDNTEYTAWDADKIYGCLCDDGWEGPRCDQRSCPKGIDPLTDTQTLAPFEIQYLECKCDNCDGGIYLVLNNEVTPVIAYDATAPVVAEELEAFPSIDRVETRLIQGDAICSSTGSVLEIKFILPRGAQNRLKVLRAQGLTGRSIAIRAKGEEVKSMYRGPQSVGSSVVLATCSNRGTCDYDTGSCVCQAGYESSDGLGNIGTLGDCGYLASSSKMYTYTIDGDSYSTYSTCPIDSSGNTCSGHGTCDSSYGRCSCDDGYQGYDCSERTCASDYAWFGLVGQDHKSLIAECSAAGICNRATGVCDCVHNAYGGTACERLTCANDTATGLICGGQGVCLPMWHLALYAYSPAKELANIYYDTPWDAAKIYGCLCERAISVDGQFDSTYQSLGPFTIQRSYFNRTIGSNDSTSNIAVSNTALLNVDDFARFHRGPYAKTSTDFIGYVCTEKRCPTGDVPTLYNHASEHLLHLNEIQEMICRANNGTFQLTFRENTTLPISFNATASELEYRLEQIFTIGDVSVTISGEKFSDYGNASTVCSADRNTTVLIEFLTEHGDVPMLQADVSYLDMNGEHIFDTIYTGNFLLNITEYQKGTTQDVECSGLGICDYSVGQCKCMPGFSSSNGSVYAPGEYGDCSYFNPLYTTEALVHPNRGNKIRRGLDTQA